MRHHGPALRVNPCLGRMFSGLIADVGSVSAVGRSEDGVRVQVATLLAGELADGDSVAVNGVCLTAVAADPTGFAADVMHETVRRSSLARLRTGSAVNVELACSAGARLGGHVVQGHVDGLGAVRDIHDDETARVLTIGVPPDLLRYVTGGGAIAVDGVSLVVTRVSPSSFRVCVLPHTLERTTMGGVSLGQTVNVEVDILAKYTERFQSPRT